MCRGRGPTGLVATGPSKPMGSFLKKLLGRRLGIPFLKCLPSNFLFHLLIDFLQFSFSSINRFFLFSRLVSVFFCRPIGHRGWWGRSAQFYRSFFFLRVHKRGEMHTVQWGIWQLTDFLLFVTRSNNQNKFCAFLKWTRMKPELPLFFVVRGSSVKPELPNSTWCFFCSINFHILHWVLYLSCNSQSDPSAVTGGRSFLSFLGGKKKTSN